MFKRLNMVAEAVDPTTAGGGVDPGQGTPPGAADPNPPPDEPRALGSPTPGDDAGDPDPQDAAPAGPRRPENAIPHSRVREMLARAREESRRAAFDEARQQLAPIFEQLDPKRLRQQLATEMLQALGQEPKRPEPKPVTAEQLEELNRRIDGRFTQYERQQQAEQLRVQDERIATSQMQELKETHGDLFEAYPDLEEDIANLWGSPWAIEQGLTVKQIGDWKVSRLIGAIGKYNEGYANRAADQTRGVTPIRPGSTRAPAPRKTPDVSTDEGARAEALRLLGAK